MKAKQLIFIVAVFFLVSGCAGNSFVAKSIDKEKYKQAGNSNYEAGNYDLALKDFSKYAELAPKDWYAWNRLGWTYYQLSRYHDAIIQFEKSNKIEKKSGNYQGLGWSYTALGRYDNALPNCSNCVNLMPEGFEGYNCLGWTYYFKGRYQEAITQFEKSNMKEKKTGNYRGLGRSYCKLGKYDEAEKYFLMALNMSGNSNDKRRSDYYRAMVILAKGQYGEAQRILGERRVIGVDLLRDNDPDKQVVHDICQNSPADASGMQLGDVLIEIDGQSLKNKNSEDASNILSNHELGSKVKVKIVRDGVVRDKYLPVGITPDLPLFRTKAKKEAKRLYDLGNASFEKKQFAIAISQYQEAIAYEDDFAPLYYNLGMAQMAVRENAQAVANLETYLKMRTDAPNSKEVSRIIQELKN